MKWYFPILMLVFQFSIAQKKSTKEIDYDQNISKAKEILELVKNISSPEDSIKITLVNGLELIKNYKEKEAQNLYANLLGELSWYEYIKSNYSKAIEIEIKALKIAEKTKDKNLLSNSNLRLGNYYAKIGGEYSDLGSGKERLAFQKMASYHLKEASKLTEMTKDSKLYLKSLASLSNFYLSTKKLDSSKLYSNLILDKAEKEDYKNRAQALNYLGIISYEEKKFNEAEYFFKKSISEGEKATSSLSLLSAKGNLANVYMEQKKYSLAKKNLFELIQLNSKSNRIQNISKNYNTLYEIYKAEKKYDSAVVSFELYNKYKDSVLDENHKNLINELNIKYESEKKDNEITILKQKEKIQTFELEKQKQLATFSIIGLIVLFAVALIVFLYQKKINTIQNLALRSKLTRSQFNPHYINNAFTSLQATLIEHDMEENIINYTSDISRFSRLLLESTFKDEWTLFEEKQMIEHYLKTQQHRYENNFDFLIKNDFSNDELHKYKLPSALTQTVLENAIEHGGYQNNKGGKIEITIQKSNTQFEISIKNNKVGTDLNTVKKVNNEPSRGLEITKQRMELHQKIHKTKTEFRFNKQENEVLVTFVLPLLNI
jgi:tetratricopeptide (TPR) repeat protein